MQDNFTVIFTVICCTAGPVTFRLLGRLRSCLKARTRGMQEHIVLPRHVQCDPCNGCLTEGAVHAVPQVEFRHAHCHLWRLHALGLGLLALGGLGLGGL